MSRLCGRRSLYGMARGMLPAVGGVLLAVVSCESTVVVESGPVVVQASSSMTVSSSSVGVGSGGAAIGGEGGCGCSTRECGGELYGCGDCIDNDFDGLFDWTDPDCVGACDDTEESYDGGTTAWTPYCTVDCYFDRGPSAANDHCYWNYQCDPQGVNTPFAQCAYDPNATALGTNKSCDELYAAQSRDCLDTCMPLVPNGCDCFGCCELPAGSDNWIWLGSLGAGEVSSWCSSDSVLDHWTCQPCMPVPSCLNDCETCELCIGKPALPPECTEPSCASDRQRCAAGCEPCPEGEYCITGCCAPVPQ